MVPFLGNAPPPTWETGAEWLAKQDPATKRKIMGPGRADIWDKVGGNPDQLQKFVRIDNNQTWGPSAQIQTVKAARQIFNIPPPEPKTPPNRTEPEEPGPPEGIPLDGRSQAAADARRKIIEIHEKAVERAIALNKQIELAQKDRVTLGAQSSKLWQERVDQAYAEIDPNLDADAIVQAKLDAVEAINNSQEILDLNARRDQALKDERTLREERAELDRRTREAQLQVLSIPETDGRSGYIAKPQKVKSKAQREEWKKGAEDFRRLVPAGLIDGVEVPIWVRAGKRARQLRLGGGQRACHYQGEIFLGKYDKADTVIHELGHALEENNPVVLQRAIDFWESRTAGEELVEMKSIRSHYGYGERTKPDHFFGFDMENDTDRADRQWNHNGAYAGKIYRRATYRNGRYTQDGEIRATEIHSMGLENLYQNPVEFARRDPDFFDFIYDLRFVTGGQP